MRLVRQSRFTPAAPVLTLMACMASSPAFADSEIDALRQELAQQKALIQQLMAMQGLSGGSQPQQEPPPVQTGGPNRGS
jgi:hypothetical protein